MDTIQVAITDASYAASLREVLARNGTWEVVCVDRPDSSRDGVMVLDSDHLEMLPQPLPNPERVVLIARNDTGDMTRAWEAGVNSVITDKDPLNTAVLAIMAARLKAVKCSQPAPARAPSGERQPGGVPETQGIPDRRSRASGEKSSPERPWKPQA